MLLLLVVFIINYRFLDGAVVRFFEEREIGVVERVIDGDTIIVGGESVRLLGINSPERGEQGFEEAKEFLEMILLGKKVELEFGIPKYDKYNRALAYVHRDGANVNLELVEEGFEAVAKVFESIAVAEKQHEKRYLALAKNIADGTVFRKDAPVVWRCLNCGYVHEGTEALDLCPACAHGQAHFELLAENW